MDILIWTAVIVWAVGFFVWPFAYGWSEGPVSDDNEWAYLHNLLWPVLILFLMLTLLGALAGRKFGKD